MPQGVDTARLADSGLVLGVLVDECGCRAVHRAVEGSAGEQQVLGPVTPPVLAQLFQQSGRERDVAVLVALALVDTHAHPGGVDVGDLQSSELARPKPRGIGRHQQGAMLGVGGDGEQTHQLVMVEDLGQGRGCLGAGQVEVRVGHTEGDAEQEAHAVAALPAQPAFLVKEQKGVLDFRGGDLVGAAPIVPGESGHRTQVGPLGVLGESANGHVVDHALTKRSHGTSPLRCQRVRTHTGGRVRRCSSLRIPGNAGRRESNRAVTFKRGCTPVHRITRSWKNTPCSRRARGPAADAAQFNIRYD